MRRFAPLLGPAFLAACTPSPPERVFVHAESYAESVDARTGQGDSATVDVGEPVVLHARRVSGPWTEVAYSSLPPDACWQARPPDVEEEVAGSLRWIVQPDSAAVFNTDFRPDRSREVRFEAPGRYVLRAESAGWCSPPYIGDSVVVRVRASSEDPAPSS